MSEPVTALGGRRFTGIATVEERPLQGMITLKGDLSDPRIKNAATGVAGVDMPGPLEGSGLGEHGIAWMAPDELLVFVPYQEVTRTIATIEKTLEGFHATVADVSDARAVFRVSGPHAREVLAKLTPADMSPEAFPPGSCRRTRLAQVPVAIWAEGEGALGLICFRSVAVYVFDLLANAAQEGASVGYFLAGA
ncbi:Sarcosine oxidase gamma subunit [Rhodovulum sp. P5]|uniref:sarcosine oxidase subunit gamma n=1 Tax=Rhodovulum sp. P5 TaxID=1564506 RepID=UPI0009C344A6|nr:sarcosine oxidase subunit gamma family protein [Rhodovulum sp. P5]ARE39691.1 Sarcosine oxidase gamma subunit [Rhodovulum sp. P5]